MKGKNLGYLLAAFISLATPSCRIEPKLQKWEQLDNYSNQMKTCTGILFRKGEYSVPDEVFRAYLSIAYKVDSEISCPGAIFIKKALEDDDKKNFIKKLYSYPNPEKSIYFTILMTPKNIVFPETLLKSQSLEKALTHERFHREMCLLNETDPKIYGEIIDDAENFLFSSGDFLEENPVSKHPKDSIILSSYLDIDEFYAYLAEGEFTSRVEKALSEKYPRTYSQFLKIKAKSSIKTIISRKDGGCNE